MLFAIMGSKVSIQISPAPVDVKRPTSKKKTVSLEPHLRRDQIKKLQSIPFLLFTNLLMLAKANSTFATRPSPLTVVGGPTRISDNELSVMQSR